MTVCQAARRLAAACSAGVLGAGRIMLIVMSNWLPWASRYAKPPRQRDAPPDSVQGSLPPASWRSRETADRVASRSSMVVLLQRYAGRQHPDILLYQ